MAFHVPNQYRVRTGYLGSDDSIGNAGLFFIKGPDRKESAPLKVIASDGEGWEHVSISLPHRCPTWAEMCFIKGLFWDDSDCVMQLHPPKSDWVNNHSYCLHLWKPVEQEIPRPQAWLVGYQDVGVLV